MFFYCGALTSKMYMFKGRSWELKNTKTIDIFDSFCSNILVSTRGSKIMRILPKKNDFINEEWITDRIRFGFDGYQFNKLTHPLINQKGQMIAVSWRQVLCFVKRVFLFIEVNGAYSYRSSLRFRRFLYTGFCGDSLDFGSVVMFNQLFSRIGMNVFKEHDFYRSNLGLGSDFRLNYLLSPRCLDHLDFLFVFGANLRLENPLLNLRIRRNRSKYKKIFFFGSVYHLTYFVDFVGFVFKKIYKFFLGNSVYGQFFVKFAKTALFLVGSDFLQKKGFFLIRDLISFFTNLNAKRSFLVLNLINKPGDISLAEGGVKFFNTKISFRGISKDISLNYYYEVKNLTSTGGFNIFHGSNLPGEDCTGFDLVLPGKSFLEKDGLFLNLSLKTQQTTCTVFSKCGNRVDWQIFKALMESLHLPNLESIRQLLDYRSLSNFVGRNNPWLLGGFGENFEYSMYATVVQCYKGCGVGSRFRNFVFFFNGTDVFSNFLLYSKNLFQRGQYNKRFLKIFS